jgi:hypothetical protein
MTQDAQPTNQTQINKTVLVPTQTQRQIGDVAVYGGLTLRQQTGLAALSQSPLTLTFTKPATVGNRLNIFVVTGNDTVATVTDDGGNSYTQLVAGTFPNGQKFEVWTSLVTTASAGVIVTMTGGSSIANAMLSEINTQQS